MCVSQLGAGAEQAQEEVAGREEEGERQQGREREGLGLPGVSSGQHRDAAGGRGPGEPGHADGRAEEDPQAEGLILADSLKHTYLQTKCCLRPPLLPLEGAAGAQVPGAAGAGAAAGGAAAAARQLRGAARGAGPPVQGPRAGDRERRDAVARAAQGQRHQAEELRGAALRAAQAPVRRDHPAAEAVHRRWVREERGGGRISLEQF